MGNTRAIQALERSGARFQIHRYEVMESDGSYGAAVAAALGVDPSRVFKTLVAEVDGNPTVAVVPVDCRLSLKALARAAGGKRARMVEARDAERLTGYVVGGISPFGRTRRLPALLDASAFDHETIFVSGGRRGIQLEVSPTLLIEMIPAGRATIAD